MHPGDDVPYIDAGTGDLTTVAMHGFAEELDVDVDDGEVRADPALPRLRDRSRPKG